MRDVSDEGHWKMRDVPMRDTFDRLNWSLSRRCIICQWMFRCPLEQLQRVTCHACESKYGNGGADGRAA